LIQTSGNCIRTPLRSIRRRRWDEIEDPRATGEWIRQWSSLHPEFDWLGRKFKIAVTGARMTAPRSRRMTLASDFTRSSDTIDRLRVLVGGALAARL